MADGDDAVLRAFTTSWAYVPDGGMNELSALSRPGRSLPGQNKDPFCENACRLFWRSRFRHLVAQIVVWLGIDERHDGAGRPLMPIAGAAPASNGAKPSILPGPTIRPTTYDANYGLEVRCTYRTKHPV